MDIYEQTTGFLLNLPLVQSWAEMQSLLSRAAQRKPHDWQLSVIACEAVGGMAEQALPAVAGIACLQISIILIDDMLDDDPRGEYRQIGAPAAANLASAFQAAGLEVVARSNSIPLNIRAAVLHSLNQMILTTAFGQHLDVQNPSDEAKYWDMIRTKSSPFFSSAMYTGALLGGANTDVAGCIQEFGNLYGELIQIHDDLNDTMATPVNPDWILDRSPLPILFAQTVNHPDRERFLELRRAIPDPEALAEAQAILLRCGAVSYCIDQIMRRHKLAHETLAAIPLVRREKLERLLDPLIDPVQKLFVEIGE